LFSFIPCLSLVSITNISAKPINIRYDESINKEIEDHLKTLNVGHRSFWASLMLKKRSISNETERYDFRMKYYSYQQ
jgi:hypothetical protein